MRGDHGRVLGNWFWWPVSLSLSLLLFVPSLLVGCGWVGHGVRVRAAELTSHRVSLSIVVTACSCCHEHVVEVVGVV